jgi:hypothetical protein
MVREMNETRHERLFPRHEMAGYGFVVRDEDIQAFMSIGQKNLCSGVGLVVLRRRQEMQGVR